MKLPTPNKDIQQLGNLLIDRYGFTFLGIDGNEHLEFVAPNGAPYKLSSTPKGSFSTKLELPQALKLAGLEPATTGRSAQNVKARAARQRDDAAAEQGRSVYQLECAIRAAEATARNQRLRIALDKRRGELISISHLMGAGHPRTF